MQTSISHSSRTMIPRQYAASSSRLQSRETSDRKRLDDRKMLRSPYRYRSTLKAVSSKTGCSEDIFIFTIISSGDCMKKKLIPSLWNLFKRNLLPKNIRFYVLLRQPATRNELHDKCRPQMHVLHNEMDKFDDFWKLFNQHVGTYLTRIDYDALNKDLNNSESGNVVLNRLFYLEIPFQYLEPVAQNIRTLHQSKSGYTRVIVERPFGKDATTCTKMTQTLLTLCSEEDLFRIDPYLNKEIVQNIPTVRFCNTLFNSTWNRENIESVFITIHKLDGIRGQGKYFDSYAVICDIMQLHGLQLIALIAMDKPIAMKPEEIRDEKIRLLKCIKPIELNDVVLGQCTGNTQTAEDDECRRGFDDDPDVACKFSTLTFCTAVAWINNERWADVPFILKCGKALDQCNSEIRIRYRKVPADLVEPNACHNELVFQIEPEERLFVKAMMNTEFHSNAENLREKEISLTARESFRIPSDVYDSLLTNVLSGVQTNFVRTAELKQAWRIFTPLLNKLEKEKIKPIQYSFCSAGPAESDRLIRKYIHGYKSCPDELQI